MPTINRRDLLKVAAATAVGGAALGAEALSATPAFAATADRSFPASANKTSPLIASTAGTKYKYYNGSGFHPMSNIVYTWFGGIGTYVSSGSTDYFIKDVEVPNGAVVTECSFDILMNDASGVDLYIYHWIPSTGASPDAQILTYTTTGTGIQTVSVNPSAPFVVDTSQGNVALYYRPHVAGTNQVLYGARVGWILEPGLTVFPGPRRVYGDGTVLAPGQTITGVKAYQKTDGTPSGVPVGAKAAYCAISSYGTGVISLYPDGTADNGIGAWASQGTAGNGVNQGYNLVPLSAAGKFAFTNYFTSKAMYFDVWGYLA